MSILYKPITWKRLLRPLTDDVLDSIVVSEESCFPRHVDALHQLAEHIEAGLAYGLPSFYMTDEEFVRRVKAGEFD